MSEIKIVEAPEVYLIGRQSVDELELARFLLDNGSNFWKTDAPSAGERLTEVAGRLCYDSFKKPRPGGNAAYIGHILDVGHGSVLEHCVFTILITGISRTLTHELVRHRVGLSPSQLSQRYVDSSDVAFVVPPSLSYSESHRDLWEEADRRRGELVAASRRFWEMQCSTALGAYGCIVERLQLAEINLRFPQDNIRTFEEADAWLERHKGQATSIRKATREAARSVLPGCTETKICLTGNARAWRHVLEMRGSEHADAEIRRLAIALLGVLQEEAVNLFSDYSIVQVDGVDTIQTPHRKV